MNKSFLYYCVNFVLLTVLVLVFVYALTFAAYTFVPDIAALVLDGGGSTGLGVATIMAPTVLIAQKFYRHETRRMSFLEGWSMAIVFTILSFAVSGAVIFAVLQAFPMGGNEIAEMRKIWTQERDLVLIIVGGVIVLYILLVRLVLWSGVRGAIKKADRLAAKSARKA